MSAVGGPRALPGSDAASEGATVALVGAPSPSGGVLEPEPAAPEVDVGLWVPAGLLVIVPAPADDDASASDVPLLGPAGVTEPSCEPCVDGPPLTVSAVPFVLVDVEVIEPVAPTGFDDVVVNVSAGVVTGGAIVSAAGATGGAGGAGGAIVSGAADAGGSGEDAEIIVLDKGTIAAVEAPIVAVGSVTLGAIWRSCAGTASSLGAVVVVRGRVTRSSRMTFPWSIGIASVVSVAAVSVAVASVAVASGVVVVPVVAGAVAAGVVATGAGNAPVVLSTIGAFANGSGFGLAVDCFGCGRVTYMLVATGTRTFLRVPAAEARRASAATKFEFGSAVELTANGLADFDCVEAFAAFGGFRRGKSNAGTRRVGSASWLLLAGMRSALSGGTTYVRTRASIPIATIARAMGPWRKPANPHPGNAIPRAVILLPLLPLSPDVHPAPNRTRAPNQLSGRIASFETITDQL